MEWKNTAVPKRSKLRFIIIIIGIAILCDVLFITIEKYIVVPYVENYYLSYKALGIKQTLDIAQNIQQAQGNKQFASLIMKAGYDSLLHGTGPYTVFVPTDQAYKNLPDETKKYFSNPANEGELRALLQYHIVRGAYPWSSLKDGMTLETIQGEKLHISKKDNYLMINDYSYIQTYDAVSKNGIIHIVTNYIIPPSILGQPEENR